METTDVQTLVLVALGAALVGVLIAVMLSGDKSIVKEVTIDE